jgi:hypothetical protein
MGCGARKPPKFDGLRLRKDASAAASARSLHRGRDKSDATRAKVVLASFLRSEESGSARSAPRAPFTEAYGSRDGFLSGSKPITHTWHLRFKVLTGFYRFAISRSFAASSPLPTTLPSFSPPFRPYIYSVDEIARLLAGTEVLQSTRNPLQGLTLSHTAAASLRHRHAHRRSVIVEPWGGRSC